MEQSRIFNCTDGELVQKADHFINIGNRDEVDLTDYGMPETYPDETQTLRDEFADMPVDEEMQSLVEVATEAKNNAREEVIRAIKDIVNRAELCFGKGTPVMKRFRTGTIGDLTDPELYRVAGRVIRAANTLLDKLAANGVTEEMLTGAKAKNATFDGLIDDREDSENERIAATALRVETANNLYKRIVKISDYGKKAYEGKNAIKSAEYLLID